MYVHLVQYVQSKPVHLYKERDLHDFFCCIDVLHINISTDKEFVI